MSVNPSSKTNTYWQITINLVTQVAAIVVLVVVLIALAGCSGLSGFLSDVGVAASGGDVGAPGVDTVAEQVVEGAELVKDMLPFPFNEAIAAILAGLAVFAWSRKDKENSNS